MCPVLAVIATEIAVLAASSAPADQAAAQAIERALGERAVHRGPVHAVRTEAFASLREARRLVTDARKHDLNVEFSSAITALDDAITIFVGHTEASEELADAYVLRGVVHMHMNDAGAAREDFSHAKRLDRRRGLTSLEVRPDIAIQYASLWVDGQIDETAAVPPAVEPDRVDEICDLLWCDGVIVVGVSERNGRASLVGTRYDANARAFTERAVAGNAHDLVDAVMRSPAFAREQPSLVLPPEPPPPKIWQRTWFWTAVGGAAAALAGSLIYADATRDVHTNVSVPAGVFGGR